VGSDSEEVQRFRQYRRMRRLRRGLFVAFFPAALLMLLVTSGSVPGIPDVFAWPLLLLFAIGCYLALQATDRCPWCGGSFHTPTNATAAGFGSLMRMQCANCGEPSVAAAPGRD